MVWLLKNLPTCRISREIRPLRPEVALRLYRCVAVCVREIVDYEVMVG